MDLLIMYALGVAVGFLAANVGRRIVPVGKIEHQGQDVMDAMDRTLRDQGAYNKGAIEVNHAPNDDLGAASGCWNPNICMGCNDMCNDVENRNCKKQRQQGNHNYPPDLR